MPAFGSDQRSRLDAPLILGLTALGYYIAARLSYSFVFHPSNVAVVWVPAGLILALLILLPRSTWPLALAGAFLGNLLADLLVRISPGEALLGATANAVEATVAAWVVTRFTGTPVRLHSLREVLVLVLGAALMSNAVTAFLGAVVLLAGGEPSFSRAWFVWWIGDGMGMLVVTPLILTWTAVLRARPTVRPRDVAEAGTLVVALVLVSGMVMATTPTRGTALSASPYMAFPFLFWGALRFGPAGAATSVGLLASVTAWYAATGSGPFTAGDPRSLDPIIEAYAFLALASVSSLVPAAILSEQREAQKKLHQSEQHYRALFESNPHPMWIYDLESLAFLAVNESAIRQYGFTRKEFLALTLRDIRPPEEIGRLLADVGRSESGILQGTWRHRRRNGTLLDVDITSHPISWMGHRARLVLAVDVSERQQLLDQLLQAQKMEAVGRLAGGIAHDFNNLLGIIIGYAELALSNVTSDSPLRPRLEEIGKAADRAAGLTRQLLAFSRKQVIEPRVLDLGSLIRNFSGMLQRTLGEHITLVTHTAANTGRVRADPGLIEQVIMNLAVNARDAMPDGGRLTIETASIDLDESYTTEHFPVVAGPYVMLAVSDTGVGMTPDIQRQIFEPFFTTKDPGKGTGLGLSTTYGIVQQSAGYIWVYSEPGRGTTFKIYLPRVDAPESETPEAEPVRGLEGNETILLVEDADGLRRLARECLGAKGYTVIAAPDVSRALELARNYPGPIHLLVTDVVLPDGGGQRLADQVTLLRPGSRTLFISGYTDNALGDHGVLDPGIAFLQKPFQLTDLWQKVREVLDQPRVDS